MVVLETLRRIVIKLDNQVFKVISSPSIWFQLVKVVVIMVEIIHRVGIVVSRVAIVVIEIVLRQ